MSRMWKVLLESCGADAIVKGCHSSTEIDGTLRTVTRNAASSARGSSRRYECPNP